MDIFQAVYIGEFQHYCKQNHLNVAKELIKCCCAFKFTLHLNLGYQLLIIVWLSLQLET